MKSLKLTKLNKLEINSIKGGASVGSGSCACYCPTADGNSTSLCGCSTGNHKAR